MSLLSQLTFTPSSVYEQFFMSNNVIETNILSVLQGPRTTTKKKQKLKKTFRTSIYTLLVGWQNSRTPLSAKKTITILIALWWLSIVSRPWFVDGILIQSDHNDETLGSSFLSSVISILTKHQRPVSEKASIYSNSNHTCVLSYAIEVNRAHTIINDPSASPHVERQELANPNGKNNNNNSIISIITNSCGASCDDVCTIGVKEQAKSFCVETWKCSRFSDISEVEYYYHNCMSIREGMLEFGFA